MGRVTWESLGGPLVERENVVLSPDAAYECRGAVVAASLTAAVEGASRPGPGVRHRRAPALGRGAAAGRNVAPDPHPPRLRGGRDLPFLRRARVERGRARARGVTGRWSCDVVRLPHLLAGGRNRQHAPALSGGRMSRTRQTDRMMTRHGGGRPVEWGQARGDVWGDSGGQPRAALSSTRTLDEGRRQPSRAGSVRPDPPVVTCHSRTNDPAALWRQADVAIGAVGRPEMVGGDWVKAGVAVIHVGINRTDAGLVGDVELAEVSAVVGAITPVPGGVEPIIIACLLLNLVRAARSGLGDEGGPPRARATSSPASLRPRRA